MANNPNHKDNLRNWQKGQSGNPNGRPKGSRNRKKVLEEIMCADIDLEKVSNEELKEVFGLSGKISAFELMSYRMTQKAINGDTHTFKVLVEMLDGKPLQQQRIEVSEEEEKVVPRTMTFTRELCDEAKALIEKHPNIDSTDLMEYVYMKNQLEKPSEKTQ